MATKEYILEINKETCDYLQRLDFEINANQSVITRLLTQSKNDVDASVLDSVPYKTYHKQMEETMYMYEQAKQCLTEELKPRIYEKFGSAVNFNWTLDDFTKPEVKVVCYA